MVVPVAYSIIVVYRYSSQDAHGTDRPVLIWYAFHWLFKHARAALSSPLFFRLPPSVHVNLPWGNLSPRLLHCSRLLSSQRLIHSTGATLLGAVLICYTPNRLLRQTLLQKPLPFDGFVFDFLSSSSSPSFLLCSLAGGLPPRMRIKLPWDHLSMAGGLAEGN